MVASKTFKLLSGHDIPIIGLGLFQIKDQAILRDAISAALSAGYRLLDTARVYENEEMMGNILEDVFAENKLSRKDVFITTKLMLTAADTAKNTRKTVLESLESLRLDYLDLVLIHYPRPLGINPIADQPNADKDPMNRTYRQQSYEELLKMKDEGKIRSVGVSNFEISHLKHLEEAGLPAPSVNQLQFHPHMLRKELRKYCEEKGIFFQAFTSLGRQAPRLIEEPKLVAIAKRLNTSPQQVLLAWALHHNAGILPKSQTPSRIRENIECTNLHLTDKDVADLDSLENGNSYSITRGWDVL